MNIPSKGSVWAAFGFDDRTATDHLRDEARFAVKK
jgi:hypothetical protein